MSKKMDWYDFEEARIEAGLFYGRLLEELGISERTLYRWKKQGKVPVWAWVFPESCGNVVFPSHLGYGSSIIPFSILGDGRSYPL